jgi:5-methylcytosine-specific restriction endonuclease McrA
MKSWRDIRRSSENIQIRVCPKCKIEKGILEFHKSLKRRLGVSHYCKDCCKSYRKNYYQVNQQKAKDDSKMWYEANRARAAIRNKIYKDIHKAHYDRYFKEHYRVNSKRIKERIRIHSKTLAGRISQQLSEGKRRARKNGTNGNYTRKEWLELKQFYNYRCPACKRKEPEIQLTIDHIVPLSKGGRHNATNIQPLCFSCNSRKNIKIVKYYRTGQLELLLSI